MITEIHENTEKAKEIGEQIMDKLAGYSGAFSKATLTVCLAKLINKNEDFQDKLIDIKTINSFMNTLCQMPVLH